MAFTNRETRLVLVPGDSGTAKLYGTGTSDGGSTGGVVSPGTGAVTVSGSSNIRKIIHVNVTNQTAIANTVTAVVAYNATTDRDEVTFTSVANEVFSYELVCEYAGG